MIKLINFLFLINYKLRCYLEHCQEKLCYKKLIKQAKELELVMPYSFTITSDISYYEGWDVVITLTLHTEKKLTDLEFEKLYKIVNNFIDISDYPFPFVVNDNYPYNGYIVYSNVKY